MVNWVFTSSFPPPSAAAMLGVSDMIPRMCERRVFLAEKANDTARNQILKGSTLTPAM